MQCIAFARSFGSMLHVGMSFGHRNEVNKGSRTSHGSVKPAEWDTSNIHPASYGSHTTPAEEDATVPLTEMRPTPGLCCLCRYSRP